VKLPLPDTPKKAVKVAIRSFFMEKMFLEWNALVPSFYHHDGWWVRCCAQVWNDVSLFFVFTGDRRELDEMYHQMSDFEYVGRMYNELVPQVIEKIIDEKGELREGYTA